MAFRIVSRCYICNKQFGPRQLSRIDRAEDAPKMEISIRRREAADLPPLDITNLTKICANCNRSIINEIDLLRVKPNCLRLNVLTQTTNSTCLICEAVNNIHELSAECRADAFIIRNIYIPEGVKSCNEHLNDEGFLLAPLLGGLLYVNRPIDIEGPQMQVFLQGIRKVSNNKTRIVDENSFTDEEMECLCPVTKEQFRDLFTFCDKVPREGGYRYVTKKDLLMFLCKIRQGLSDNFLKVMFQYPSRQTVSQIIATVRQSLMQRFVPNNIGFDAITREEYLNTHVTDFANELYNSEPETPRVITIIDGTYAYIQKSANFKALRMSYCVHKGRHLVKPVLIVAPDGYILDIQGPYFSDSKNNDAAILRNEFEKDADRMLRWFQEDDIMLVDRGYRDATELLARLGIVCKMPALLARNEQQLTTEDANESRLITILRWIVEARNGHIKSIFKFFQQVIQMHHVINIGDFYRIAGAIINKYHPPIIMANKNVAIARQLLEKARQPNEIQALVEERNLRNRNAQRWVPLNADQLLDFPILPIEYLQSLTVGVYQVKLAPSYVQDKLQRENDEEFQLEMLRNSDEIPIAGLIRVRVFSRFRNATKYQLWISYQPNANGVMVHGMENEDNPIKGYYCTCKNGARTVGACAHVTSVAWFLGTARHEDNVRYPTTKLLNHIYDAGNRNQQNNNELQVVEG